MPTIKNSIVSPTAKVLKNAIVKDSMIKDRAVVTDNAVVEKESEISNFAMIKDNAYIGGAEVSGYAVVGGNVRITSPAVVVTGNAEAAGSVQMRGNARLSGDAYVAGNAILMGDADIGGDAHITGGIWDGSEGVIRRGTYDKNPNQEDVKNYRGDLAEAEKDGFALCIIYAGAKGASIIYRMYNGKPKVYGAVLLAMSDDPCWNAYIVTHSAGIPGTGLGGCAYEAALYAFPLVAPDRGSVSDLAQRVWERYNKRPDIIKRPFDDIENPKTSTPEDDCYLHNMEALDQAYKLTKKPAGYDKMRAKHLEYGASPKVLEKMGVKLFENGY